MSYLAEHCPACGAASLEFRAAIVAPFVAERAFNQASETCRLARCKTCDFQFFERRFDDAEAGRLYSGYRHEEYFRARHRWEPWYTRALNFGLGNAEEFIARRAAFRDAVQESSAADEIDTVLDYGGDRGQMMLGGPGRQHFVFDISGVEAEPGVTRLDADTIRDRSFDLVILCEVLEHISRPVEYLRHVTQHIRLGGLLYITVPNRDSLFDDIPRGAWYGAWLRFILRSRWLTIVMDFWSTAFRVKFKQVPPLGFLKLHEHINSFSAPCLAQMLSSADLSVLTCRTYLSSQGLLAVCRRNGKSSEAR